MNHFIKLQFEDLYNFNYKLSLKENIKDDELKILGFSDKKIKKIFVQQNNWITVLSIIIGLPTGYYMTS